MKWHVLVGKDSKGSESEFTFFCMGSQTQYMVVLGFELCSLNLKPIPVLSTRVYIAF